jgi:uncharacterized protein (DUF433 family)
MIATRHSYLGKGAYSLRDASRMLHTHHATIKRWLSPDDSLVAREFEPDEGVISFPELMELHFIKMFRDKGVSLRTIRRASREASARFETRYPFAVKRFDTDGKTIFATLSRTETDEELVEDLRDCQYVFSNIVRPFFRKLDYEDGDVARFWPMHKRGRVVLDPARQFGRPIDSKTDIPTWTLFSAVRAGKGQSVKEVADWFGVPVQAVQASVKFESSLEA